MASEPTLSTLAMMAESSASAHVTTSQDASDPYATNSKTKEQARKHYLRTLHKVVDDSDIVILVLDARDPEGCRSRLVEEEVRRREADGKKLVFVLNKVGACSRFLLILDVTMAPRLGSQVKCTAVAQIPAAFHSYPSFPLPLVGTTSANQHIVRHRSCACKAAEGLQA